MDINIISTPEHATLFPGFEPTKRPRPEASGLTKIGARLLSLLHRLTKNTGYVYARQIELARMLGCTDRQVRRCLEDLAIRGHVHWERYGARNHYFLGSPVKPKCPDICPDICPGLSPKMSGSPLDDLKKQSNNSRKAAAEIKTKPEEGATTLRQPTQRPSGPAAEPSAISRTDCELVNALMDRGLSEPLARHAVSSSDPALIREILVFHRGQKYLRSPVGALRSMLENPTRWGIGPGWKAPTETQLNRDATGDKLFRDRQERERRRQEVMSEPWEDLRG
jgi:hypothetical protein